MKKKIVLISSMLCALCIGALTGTAFLRASADTPYYTLGNASTPSARIEAEAHSSNTKYSSYQTIDGTATVVSTSAAVNSSGALTIPVNMEHAGTYAVKIGYFVGCNSNQTDYKLFDANNTVTANGGTPIKGVDLAWNGFDNDYKGYGKNNNRRMCFYDTITGVALNAGENTVVITNNVPSPYCVHYDHVEFYTADDVYYYPIEYNLGMVDGLKLYVGDRIEMEWGVPTDYHATKYSNSVLNTSYRSGGYAVGLGTSAAGAATLNYTVYAEKEGEYNIQIVNSCAKGSAIKHVWTVSQGEWSQTYNYVFDGSTSEAAFLGTGNYIPTAWRRSIYLKKGANNIAITLADGSASHETDHFTIFEKTMALDTVHQAEHYALNQSRLTYSESSYSVISGYAAEMKQTNSAMSFPVSVTESGYYDVFLRIYANHDAAYFRYAVDEAQGGTYVEQRVAKRAGLSQMGNNPAKASDGDNVFRVYLTAGAHDITVRAKDENKVFSFDWVYVTKAQVQQESFVLERGEEQAVGIAMTSENPNVAKYENGKILAVGIGTTRMYYERTMTNGYVYKAYETVTVNGSFLVKDRIEAENGTVSTGAPTTVTSAKASNGVKINLNGGTMSYRVKVDADGEYALQVALTAEANALVKHVWSVTNGSWSSTEEYTFDGANGEAAFAGTGNVIPSSWRRSIALKAGINVITVAAASDSAAHQIDHFTVLPLTAELGVVQQMEWYAQGNVNTSFGTSSYAVIDGHGAELNHNAGYEKAIIRIPVTVTEAGYYDLFIRIYSNHTTAQFNFGINAKTDADYELFNIRKRAGLSQMGNNLAKLPDGDNFYRIYLPAGENVLTIRTEGKVYTFDWFYLAKTVVMQDSFDMDAQSSMSVDSTLTVADESIAVIEDGLLKGLKGGKTFVKQIFAFDNGYTYEKLFPLTVRKIAYSGTDLVAQDQTVAYNGAEQVYNADGAQASAPSGWKIDYSGRKPLVMPESQKLLVRFSHDVYDDVVKEVAFTVAPAVYEGTELVAESVTGFYDGVTRYEITASAPTDWEIFYSTNGRTVPGVTTVCVTFTKDGYAPVQKTATITVNYAAEVLGITVNRGATVTAEITLRIADEVFADASAKLVISKKTSFYTVSLSDLEERNGVWVYAFTPSTADLYEEFTVSVSTAVGICKKQNLFFN